MKNNIRMLFPVMMLFILPALFAFLIDQKEIPLWPKGAPGSEGKTGPEKVRVTDAGEHVISSIHNPSIMPYLPAKDKATGVAIIIAPGGGHRELWIDHEGYSPAQWFSDHGIAAFVLKYRLAKEEGSTYSVEGNSLADIQRAIRMVRNRSKEWGIDTAKVGVMGFSAGGELAAIAAMKFDKGNPSAVDPIDRENSRPNFQALIYPGGSAKFEVTKQSPPIFLLGGNKDRDDIALGLAEVYLKYRKAGIPAELHIYGTAGHGFGVRKTNQGSLSGWMQRLEDWLKDGGFVKEVKN